MHCSCCDRLLNDYECSIKHRETGVHLDTCSKCLEGLGIPFVGNTSLSRKGVEVNEDCCECEADNLEGIIILPVPEEYDE